MARRAMWKGEITFGSIRVPVKLYSAIQEIRVDLNLLHDEDLSPVRQEMVCSVEGVPVQAEHRVKGIKIEDEYVLVSQEELDAFEPEPSRDITVKSFVSPDEIDPRYVERAYYLGPDTDLARYSALLAALEESGKMAVAEWTMRKRSYIGAFYPAGGALVMLLLRYQSEIVPAERFETRDVTVSDRERTIAFSLIDALTGDFKPEEYAPEYPERLRQLIAEKAEGKEVTVAAPVEAEPTPEADLASVLEASLREVRKRRAA